MKLSVLMPVYNEQAGLEAILRRVHAVPVDKEIIVVDDCSTDGTAGILERIDLPDLKVFRHSVNQGKGAAIRTAIAAAQGDAIIIQDADLEYSPEEYPQLLAPILSGDAAVVYGVRDLAGSGSRPVGATGSSPPSPICFMAPVCTTWRPATRLC